MNACFMLRRNVLYENKMLVECLYRFYDPLFNNLFHLSNSLPMLIAPRSAFPGHESHGGFPGQV